MSDIETRLAQLELAHVQAGERCEVAEALAEAEIVIGLHDEDGEQVYVKEHTTQIFVMTTEGEPVWIDKELLKGFAGEVTPQIQQIVETRVRQKRARRALRRAQVAASDYAETVKARSEMVDQVGLAAMFATLAEIGNGKVN